MVQCLSCGREIPGGAEQRFCAVCGAALPDFSQVSTQRGPAGVAVTAHPHTAFLPGTIVGNRYRMIGLLGRGGMGEVYRADDLKLGQPVALKFLPADVVRDADRLERFLGEVRVSLRVTHPNVCRVFDIGEVDGRHFLTMEYVDGEDLASLLRRIGRLPEDKAIEVARQLCAGLAAAHEEGVLHRDLKPANIMIDGRGRAKIADFGLAGATVGIAGAEARAGTPQYMAPEQISGGALSERTDLYALGLVLYEMFTGKRVHQAGTFDELRRAQASAPTSPSTHVSGLNPLVERAIVRCLEPDPANRPASAKALAAALPGGDPLAMAIAAGDTPSPEMVAAAGSDAGLKPVVAWTLLAFTLAGGLLFATLSGRPVVVRTAVPTRPPDVMADRSRDLLARAGFTGAAQDAHWGLAFNDRYLSHVSAGRPVDPRDTMAARGLVFWYRDSPELFQRLAYLPNLSTTARSVDFNDPVMQSSGEHRLVLDGEGRLVSLEAVPPPRLTTTPLSRDVDWSLLFAAAGLDRAAWVPADPEWTPPFHADRQYAWRPRDGSASPTRVEAASYAGRPVSFYLVFPWSSPPRGTQTAGDPRQRIASVVATLLLLAVMLGCLLVARRNVWLGRADTQGAVRLGTFTGAMAMLIWLLEEHHVASTYEIYLAAMAVGWGLLTAALVAVFYLAVEPFVRRIWPALIVSWSRVLAGSILDPLVARDVLIGCAAAIAVWSVRLSADYVALYVTGRLPNAITSVRPLLGAGYAVSQLMSAVLFGFMVNLGFVFLLIVFRLLVRKESFAIVLCALLLGIVIPLGGGAPPAVVPLTAVTNVIVFLVVTRVGLLAALTTYVVGTWLQTFPLTWSMSAWYSREGFVGIAAVAALAVTAFRVATAPHRSALRSAASASPR